MARQIHDAKLTQDEKDKAYKTLGVTRDEVRYDYLANQTTDVSVNYLMEKLSNQPHDIVIERLLTGRENSISGPQFVTDAVLSQLADEGLITSDEEKQLKQVKYNRQGQLIATATGRGKKISLDGVKGVKPKTSARFKLSGPNGSGSKTANAPKLKQIKITPPKGAKFTSTFKPTLISPKLRTVTKNYKGLGRIG
jgi:hypothetical protein